MESAKYFYPAIFRAYPGKGEDDVCPLAGAPAEEEIKYNGKWGHGLLKAGEQLYWSAPFPDWA